MGEVITMLQEQPFYKVKDYFKEDIEIFNSYVTFLSKEGFVFYTQSKDCFVQIEEYWTSPEFINNAVVEYGFDNYNLQDILHQLDNLLVKFLEFRFTYFQEKHISKLEDILKYSSHSVLRGLRVYMPYTSKELSRKIIDLIKSFPIVECIIFFDCEINKSIEKDNQQTFFITQTLEEITNANIDKKFLVNNIDYYYECQKHNPYYNKKVSIDVRGQIKNCIKNKAVFGNVNDYPIKDIVSTEDFQEFWYVTHDQIIDIQDSELRYNYIITNDLEKINDGRYKVVM